MSDQETALEFPCQFPIKAMGATTVELDLHVVEIIRKHVNDLHEGAVKTRTSSGGKYVSVTVIITATSKDQLDAIYQDLTDSPLVLMAL